MKSIQKLNNNKSAIVGIDPALDKYRDKIMFPKKLEKAKKMLKNAKLPPKRDRRLNGSETSLSKKG